jgi:hypothetical protein
MFYYVIETLSSRFGAKKAQEPHEPEAPEGLEPTLVGSPRGGVVIDAPHARRED